MAASPPTIASAGQEMRAGHFEKNNAGVPQITVTQLPAHGAAVVREGTAVPERALKGGEDPLCQGRELRGTHIYYTPARGYVGDDVLAFQCLRRPCWTIVLASARRRDSSRGGESISAVAARTAACRAAATANYYLSNA